MNELVEESVFLLKKYGTHFILRIILLIKSHFVLYLLLQIILLTIFTICEKNIKIVKLLRYIET